MGRDLENAKGKDREYYSILGQLKESYRQCGPVSFICMLLVFIYIGLRIMVEVLAKSV